MPRKLRVQYEGAIYHVINRGDRGEAIFIEDDDRWLFLKTLGEACQKTGWQIHAYCLMNNHFHLIVETPRANLVAGMKWFLGTYSTRFNRRHKYFGHLFSGRYKSLTVDGSESGYLKTVCEYVHLNPVRAQLLQPDQPLKAFLWSSWPAYLQKPAQRPAWLRVDRWLGEVGLGSDTAASRRCLEAQLEGLRQAEAKKENPQWKRLRRAWYWGSVSFRQEMLEIIDRQRGPQHCGEELKESDEHRAQRLIAEMLRDAGWNAADLEEQPKGQAKKARMAARLRAETSMTWPWIASHLSMGHWRTAYNATRTIIQAKK
ncbi:MAG: transposase [Verrucomicrobiota bacterium]